MATLPQKLLEESKEKYRALFDSNMIGIAISDLENSILEVNDAFLEVIGYTRQDFKKGNLTWADISPKKYDDIDIKKLKELVTTGRMVPFEKEYIHKKGHLVPVLVGATCVRNKPLLGVCYALDISEQKNLEKKKDEFIGTVSHELKTPLAVLKMQVSLLQEDIQNEISPESLSHTVFELNEQIDRLNILITDLLNLARLTGDGTQSPRTLVDIRACVEKSVKDFSLVSKRKIRLKREKDTCYVQGSEMRLSQVFTNLISNALRYSPEESVVKIEIQKKKKHVRISVRDYGRGIKRADFKKIFTRYYRAEHTDEHTLGSTGIGLHVCGEIVKQHGGRIEVESAVGKGSVFSCVLPLASL